jgi:hypothetical protein
MEIIFYWANTPNGHHFMLVATDYFTKWTEAVPLKNMTHKEVIEIIMEHIIHRFGIPQTLMTDQGTTFISSPYYAQAIGQAE